MSVPSVDVHVTNRISSPRDFASQWREFTSNDHARRLIDGGGVKINGKAVAPKSYNIDPSVLKLGDTLSVGKRKGFKLV